MNKYLQDLIKLSKFDTAISMFEPKIENEKAYITLKEPAFGVAAGQLAVFYDGQKVIGSAWIESAK